MCPEGGPHSLTRLPEVKGQLIAVCGTADSSSPPEECAAIQAAFHGQDVNAQRMRFCLIEGGDHGFMCEVR